MKEYTYTTTEGTEFKTSRPQEVQFIVDMKAAGIPWRVYSGRNMFGRECPAAVTGEEFTDQDIYRATEVRLLRDSLGKNNILYTG